MKIELHPTFEMGDDPEFTRFVAQNLSSILILAYLISCASLCGIVVFANWLLK